jgi:hypothetical protein
MKATENDKNAVLGLAQNSLNPQDKALANEVLAIISKAMNGDKSAESDFSSIMARIAPNTMLHTICERMNNS